MTLPAFSRLDSPSAEVARKRRFNLRVRYGITPEQYDEMFERQGGVCALCGERPRGKHPLCVDHDHETGVVRGLLHNWCNRKLAGLENPVFMAAALRYLGRSSE